MMESDANESANGTQSNTDIKVHRLMCTVLRDVLDRVTWILPAIESARPGSRLGIQELCSINNHVEKGKLIIQHCTESSKLYLAITAEATLLRCQRIRSSLSQSLCLIQTLVQPILAAQIVEVIEYINDANFSIDPSEEEAGKSILELLHQADTSEELEFSIFQFVASELNLTTPKSILIERRAIKKLLQSLSGDKESKKQGVLMYLLYLVKKHGKSAKENINPNTIKPDLKSHKPLKQENSIPCSVPPPPEFLCPISSKLMLDPVIISSGQTFERENIEKWFEEGNVTCPKTKTKLDNFSIIPNNAMKDLIASWRREHCMKSSQPSESTKVKSVFSQEKRGLGSESGSFSLSETLQNQYSITSLRDVSTPVIRDKIRDLPFQYDHSNISIASSDSSFVSDSSRVFKGTEGISGTLYELFPWSCDFQNHGSLCKFNREMFSRFFSDLSQLELEAQTKAVEEFKIVLKGDEETVYSMVSNGFVEELFEYLKGCCERCDLEVLSIGLQLFLVFFKIGRFQMPYLNEDSFNLFSSLLETKARHEVLLILDKLTEESAYVSRITESDLILSLMQLVQTEEDADCLDLALKILCKIPTQYGEIASLVVTTEFITKIACLLNEETLAKYCLKLMGSLSYMEETLKVIVETDGCLASISEFLDTGTRQEQDHALVMLLSLCSDSFENCSLLMKEGVIPALVDISVNGSQEGKGNATKLLCLLRDLRNNELLTGSGSGSVSPTGSVSERIVDLNKENAIIEEVPTLKPSLGFFARKIKLFSKTRSGF
ncbi:RING/U-box superfamily protein with ARM repeat domain-containing protein [Rhynchospora pubera]|uniref:RING-type E3 ubiquitin transferase n=1 Tax=Rhynchospora pubera TaxID=906938 RepID=A0AAV8GYZ1_9POAL|nr:RING/U-box superfamily protein with ARM repeat domain-containing protein [Rhynchospora pubera]